MDREHLSLLLGIMIIAIAIVLHVLQLIAIESTLALISFALTLIFGGRIGANNPERVLARAMRAGRKLEPIVIREGNKLIVYVKTEPVPQSFHKLIMRYAKLTGCDVEYRVHGGVRLL